MSFPTQARGSRCLTNPFVCFRKISYGFRNEPLHTDVDRYVLVVELCNYQYKRYYKYGVLGFILEYGVSGFRVKGLGSGRALLY
jgi:hypothetical protein